MIWSGGQMSSLPIYCKTSQVLTTQATARTLATEATVKNLKAPYYEKFPSPPFSNYKYVSLVC